ncbi:hypothetical protein Bca4012_101885 [Brassica carinata]|uniref:(rape) hypothetical protein n=1 Tax=Brassica napus TaxID=3708 RepID=A0A816QRC5_BRANA|nr:unnamed protein product [Brassica napus]
MLLFILSPFQARDLMAISSIKLDGLSLILATIAWRIRFRRRKDATIHLLCFPLSIVSSGHYQILTFVLPILYLIILVKSNFVSYYFG